MRLMPKSQTTLCALSAVLMSGCSWLGMDSYSTSASGAQYCPPSNCAAYGTGAYGAQGYGAAYAAQGYAAQGYGATGMVGGQGVAGYGGAVGAGAAGYGMGGLNGYGAAGGPAGVGYAGAYGVNTQGGLGAYGNGTVTTIGGAAPFGAAVGVEGLRGTYGAQQYAGVYGQNVVASQYANGQVLAGTAVQTVQGAPIYVPQPYGVPVGVGAAGFGGTAVGAALPWGLSLFGGTDFDVDGDIRAKGAGPAFAGFDADGNPTYSTTTEVGDIALSYDDAFKPSKRIGLGLERDLNRTTTVFGQASYAKADGDTAEGYTTVTNGTYDAAGVFTPGVGETPRSLDATFSDLETYTAEVGLRKYVGAPAASIRPYLGASAGATYNDDVTFVRTYSDDGTVFAPEQTIIESGWNPTAAGIIGAEMAVGHRGAIGIESGVRWTDNLDVVDGGGDSRITVPLTLRGRVAF